MTLLYFVLMPFINTIANMVGYIANYIINVSIKIIEHIRYKRGFNRFLFVVVFYILKFFRVILMFTSSFLQILILLFPIFSKMAVFILIKIRINIDNQFVARMLLFFV
jgi:hypothetical protein